MKKVKAAVAAVALAMLPVAAAALDATAAPNAPPPVLLDYQQRWIEDPAQLKICEKSRRVGMTWAEAADNVLTASSEGGSNVFYISATQDMAREYIEACAMWARAMNVAATEMGDGIYDDGQDAQGNRRYIKTLEINFPKTGCRIVALSSRPTNLRGKQGKVVIDEGAFAPDLAELIKAAMAMLLWGDKVCIISTHDGVENPFNQLIEEVRAGKRGSASVHRVTFADAIKAGLFRRVCLRKGRIWTQTDQDKWVADAYAFYGDGAAEELDVVPSQSSGAYLPLSLITSRMVPTTPVVREKWDVLFGELSADVRRFAVEGWLKEKVTPILNALHKDRRHSFGEDFGRLRDLTVITILERGLDLIERCVLVIELSNCPFAQQQQILWHTIDRLPRFSGGAMDAGGNGAMLAELTAQRYGTQMVEQIKLSEIFYREHMPKLKAALQDGTLLDLPRDEQIRDDLRAIRVIDGTPKLPKTPTQRGAEDGPKLQRHGDAAIAFFLAIYNSYREVGQIDWTPVRLASQWDDGEDLDSWGLDDVGFVGKSGV
jgi:phage FluMu gp28-like protein